ncbi:1-phosphatidylinositol 4,5-bisphosphate phosphodiesterase zeta-1 isoform X2 [Mastomys coucha]|uniref:1-phosphatidylinositol 4,5-bisphosphate phosphodiesterase zeta-1 isoform X2 n=1 Tax=Mastomys coucha TaxID=35658 RepID=UPI001261EAAA|nr:1-phosphatidylinositol 4,5-bisphosphate phosphodiesterase zeta-1 isoform X2 [Mastomys coucha]
MESRLHELAEARWFLSKIQDEFRGGKISVESTHKLLEKLDFPCHFAHVKHIFKENDRQNQGRISIEEFRAIYRYIVHREEITEIFNTYTENRKILSESSLIEFLTQEQYEMEIDHSESAEIIEKYEPIAEVKNERQMSIEGFARYMFSKECLLFKEKCQTVYQDMNHPLNDYFISSSHNTYLLSDQILGPSDIWGYISALVKGCRSLEIDCWDGAQNEPIVYHGYTFTSKLLFKTVVQAINKYAFVTSDYPVVLSLENHCSPGQQEVMANILQSTLGDFLLSDMLDEFPDSLPSPETRKLRIAMALSDLVIYTKAEKLRSFQYSRIYQQFNEINSIGESRARKLSKLRVHEFIFHTATFITRVYPKLMRADSSNFNPQEFWNVGCQMVALNFQTPGVPMDLQNGKFLDNGGSGYVLKPDILRDTTLGFNPIEPEKDGHPITLTIRLISGIQLPVSLPSNTPDISVIIEIYGVPNDRGKQQTRVVKNNAFSPKWNETFTFLIQEPELALIRFAVETQQGFLSGSELLGQYTLPVLCMNKGYRRVPLLSKSGANLEPSSLFIYVWYFRE